MQHPEFDCIDCLDCYCGRELRRAIRDGDNLIKVKYLRRTEKPVKVPLLKPPNPKRKKGSQHCACTSRATRPPRDKSACSDRNKPSLRVLELACPTKRHCLQTLKDKAHVLPIEMVAKLTEQVLLKGPVFGVDDAVNMWAKQKTRLKRQKRTLKRRIEKDERFRQYSVLLAKKLLPHIEYPYDISISPELKRLACVVAKDMEGIWKKRKRGSGEMIADVSKKMAIWMSTIIEKAEELLLEDDIRDLEEQFGPVFEVIDDIIDRVMKLCTKISQVPNENKEFIPKSSSNLSTAKDSKVKFTSSVEDYEMIAATSKEVVQDVIDKASLSILNQIKSGEEFDIKDLNTDNNLLDLNEKQANDSLKRFITNVIDDLITNDIDVEADVSTKDVNVAEPVAKETSLSHPKDQSDSYYSLSSDETSRKVTFSFGELAEPWRETIKNLVLSEAKPSLLSDADDNWPPNHIPVVRSLMQINKSVTSLGIIEENEKPQDITKLDDEISINFNIDMLSNNTPPDSNYILDMETTIPFNKEENANQADINRTNMIVGEMEEERQNMNYETNQINTISEQEHEQQINLTEENTISKVEQQQIKPEKEHEYMNDKTEDKNTKEQEFDNLKYQTSNLDTTVQGENKLDAIDIKETKYFELQKNKHLIEKARGKSGDSINNIPQPLNSKSLYQSQRKIKNDSKLTDLDHVKPILNYNRTIGNDIIQYQSKPEQHFADNNKNIYEKQLSTSGEPQNRALSTSYVSRNMDKVIEHKISNNRADNLKRHKGTPDVGFNYKVVPGSAPFWVKRDEIELGKRHRKRYCEDLLEIAKRLEEWAQWIEMSCLNMLVINRCKDTLGPIESDACVCRGASPWADLQADVIRHAARWRGYARRAARSLHRDMLKMRVNTSGADQHSSSGHLVRCECSTRH